ncbi:unnamed protein product [Calicophoron daubneyi]|uniref:Transmembrane protein n=1 Tax=Calicophoron daubneyi TaxID=300641 RepID=A0AAV2TSZ8_CALDB
MASRVGARAAGTDGADFRHREKVAPQYNHGPFLKRRIRFVFFLHFMIWVLMFIRLFPELCLRFGFKTRLLVEKRIFGSMLGVSVASSPHSLATCPSTGIELDFYTFPWLER